MSALLRNTELRTNPSARITPVRILSTIAVLVVLFILLAPQERADVRTMYSSYAAGDGGVRALYEVLGRVGFAVSRSEKSLASLQDTASTYVLITPAQPLTSVEENQLLRAVRHGAVLVFTADDETLVDSLNFDVTPPLGLHTLDLTTVAGGNPPKLNTADPRSFFPSVFPISATVRSTKPAAGSDTQTFLWLDPPESRSKDIGATQLDSAQLPALILGHRIGRGYAIAIAPSTILMNQVARDPRIAIAIVRAIQFATNAVHTTLRSGLRSDKVVFDEYHHGFGAHADMVGAVEYALTMTSVGRVTLEVVAAALVLLLAFGVRPLAPVSIPPVSRRSPLEHVGALAHAYSQVDARNLGANRLVRGLRRRHTLGLPKSIPDSAYLSALRSRLPSASADIANISAALVPNSPNPSDHFATIGAAIANIERAFRE